MSYYDVDSILSDAQKVPTKFNLDVLHLSHLDSTYAPNSKSAHVSHALKKNSILPLPLWLSEILLVAEVTPTLVTLDLPEALSSQVLSALKASPVSVDLRTLATHYYALGARILELFEEEELLDVLIESWRGRAEMIADFAARGGAGTGTAAAAGQEGVEFLRGLDEWERGLWSRGFEGGKRLRGWMAEVGKR